MRFTESNILNEDQKRQIIQLWNSEYPSELSLSGIADFDQYLETLSDKNHILLEDENRKIKGWLIYFMRDSEQCFAMLLHPSLQGQGWGSKLLNQAKERTSELNGWVIDNDNERKQNGEYYKSPIAFYRKNNFEVRMDIQQKRKNINGIRVTWRSNK